MTDKKLAKIAFKACKQSDVVLERICYIAVGWGNDVLDILLEHYNLEKPPVKWEELFTWQERVLPELEKVSKKVLGKYGR